MRYVKIRDRNEVIALARELLPAMAQSMSTNDVWHDSDSSLLATRAIDAAAAFVEACDALRETPKDEKMEKTHD